MQSAGVCTSTAYTGSIRRGDAIRNAEYATRRAVGMTCPPPRCSGSGATAASRILNFTFRIGSSQSGPSRVPHWNPCTTLSLTAFNKSLSTSDGRVSFRSAFAPWSSGPNAHTLRAARTSQSYLFWKKSPSFFFGHFKDTSPVSMSCAKPLSSGSAIIVNLFRLFGVSAKHFSDDVSTTVSQNVTTGSATLTSTSLYKSRRSFMIESSMISPVPMIVCSPLSSTFVTASGYDLLIFLNPSTIFGRSLGFSGSVAIFTTDWLSNASGLNTWTSSFVNSSTSVAVFEMLASTPSIKTHVPAVATSIGILYRASYVHRSVTVFTAQSSSSSGEYASPRTRTRWPFLSVPLMTRPSASNALTSDFGYSFEIITCSGPSASQFFIAVTTSSPSFALASGPPYA
mmetsp:Transcript_622/g.2016  ORF Transcript_622/g.2016 Transcript_622/m.2016 type:complete len:398 (-) Transcript_622:1579-2772(-)